MRVHGGLLNHLFQAPSVSDPMMAVITSTNNILSPSYHRRQPCYQLQYINAGNVFFHSRKSARDRISLCHRIRVYSESKTTSFLLWKSIIEVKHTDSKICRKATLGFNWVVAFLFLFLTTGVPFFPFLFGFWRFHNMQLDACTTKEKQVRKYSPLLESQLLSENNVSTTELKAIPDIWRSSAERFCDRVALVDPHHDPPTSMTYKQVAQSEFKRSYLNLKEVQLSCLSLQIWLRRTLKKLDSLLVGVCQDFKEASFLIVVDAYALIGDVSVLADSHTVLKNIVLQDLEAAEIQNTSDLYKVMNFHSEYNNKDQTIFNENVQELQQSSSTFDEILWCSSLFCCSSP